MYGIPPYQKRYQTTVTVDIGKPLKGSDGTFEDNPFFFQSISNPAQPGSFTIMSATCAVVGNVYWDDDIGDYVGGGDVVVNQYWRYQQGDNNYTGTHLDLGIVDLYNRLWTEDLAWPTWLGPHTCVSDFVPEIPIDIRINEKQVSARVAGALYNASVQQACTSFIEGFEININAECPNIPITFSDGGPDELPNLRPYQPAGWSDKIVASNIRKTNIDKQDFEPRDTIYIDFAVLNAGNAEPAENFEINLYVDDILRHTWNVPRLEANYYAPINDFSIGHLDVGSHEIKISVDSTKVIAETDEQDNEYTKRIVVVEPPLISIIEMLLLQD